MHIVAALVVVVLAACVGPTGPEGPPGAPGENGSNGASGSPAEDFVSGQRIHARATTTVTASADGAMRSVTSFSSWFDTMRNEPCSPLLAADGKTRCMPQTGIAISFYADSACTVPVAYTSGVCPPPAPAYVAVYQPTASCQASPVGPQIYARGAAQTTYYTKNGVACEGPSTLASYTFYPIAGAEIPPTSFAEMTVTTTTE